MNCWDCQYWGGFADMSPLALGECRRHAPVASGVMTAEGPGVLTVWPLTHHQQKACGDFLARPVPAPTHRAPGEQ